ncbi:MAG TPA: alanine--tRNA ligase [Egibacteraceae bacterium]|nr:alanine--tRNA ligase [Egibacteraceae bacterium]
MQSSDIRRTFLDHFRAQDHRVWPSSSLIPNDPTLLLTVAGMVQFKPFFLGESLPEHPRAASVQKCARTLDIENVGVTTRHLTFFEMLGNFSFGDYFKREAIRWAWELSTRPAAPGEGGGFGFDPERIWATVYTDDDEAERLWLEESGIPASRIVRRGKKDNFWSTGGAGPCGPCSELYYDRGPEHGAEGGPEADENRYLEFWNLVFMQFEQDAAGNIVGTLPKQNVDTGMGLERMAVLLQDVPNVYEIDTLGTLLSRALELTNFDEGQYQRGGPSAVSARVLAEHSRSAAMLIADGVLPSNEGRGYILRRLLRRAVRHVRLLGEDKPVMPDMMHTVIEVMGDAWPELKEQSDLILKVAQSEEQSFSRTLSAGMSILEKEIGHANDLSGAQMLSGETAFKLHDTYGFPIELTLEIAQERGLLLDRDEFLRAMEEQRTRARGARRGKAEGTPVEVYREAAAAVGGVEFLGYDKESAESKLAVLLTADGPTERAGEGDELEVVLPLTPFYAEGGGQLGDHGVIQTETGRLEVLDTVAPISGLTVHRARVVAGEIAAGQPAHAEIDHARRASIRRGHTATHILHASLKEVVGDHAAQAGSAIDAGRFRFDFPHFSAVEREQLAAVEALVNDRIAAGPEVRTTETTLDRAREMGATALFGEKYGERVRVVEIGEYSRELCGGTHVGHATEVGLFTIVSEGSIAANLRRIEAITGPEAFAYLSKERLVAEQVARLLKVSGDEVAERVGDLLERLRAAEKEIARLRQEALMGRAAALLGGAEDVDGARLIAAEVPGADRDGLKALASDLANRAGTGVVVLGARTDDGSALLFAAVSGDLDAEGVGARDVLQPGAKAVGGGAGGKGATAQAGGKDGGKLADALEASRVAAREAIRAARA